jgi:hypothetical protein
MGAVPSVEGCVAPFRFLPYSLEKIRDRGGLRWRKKLDGLGENMRHRDSTLHFSFSSDFFPETRWREGNGRAFERFFKKNRIQKRTLKLEFYLNYLKVCKYYWFSLNSK